MKKKISDIILMNLDMIIIILYFVLRFLTFTSPEGSFGFDNFIILFWWLKIFVFSIFLILYIICYLFKLNRLLWFFVIALFVYNTISFIIILVLSDGAGDGKIISTYLLPFVCSLSQLFRYKKIKNNA